MTGADLAALRGRLGLTQSQAADMCCLGAGGQVNWSRWESRPVLAGWALLAFRWLAATDDLNPHR